MLGISTKSRYECENRIRIEKNKFECARRLRGYVNRGLLSEDAGTFKCVKHKSGVPTYRDQRKRA